MVSLIAIDVAVLPPADVAAHAISLSATLPPRESQGLLLDANHLPHVTLTQHFVDAAELPQVATTIGNVLTAVAPFRLAVAGAGKGGSSVWMQIERSPAIHELHRRLMDALRPFERQDGGAAAFADADARPRDVEWVARFRDASAYDRYTPHITLGHALRPPPVEPSSFLADSVALCQLGRFCSCRDVLRRWTLSDSI